MWNISVTVDLQTLLSCHNFNINQWNITMFQSCCVFIIEKPFFMSKLTFSFFFSIPINFERQTNVIAG